ncbi:LacI family DNA-binding transcriptional regulator [Falsirhodobacter algicola]|uniref:Substrate-binding domain-containing protein n=1 Tax=Falsirhodobacter algicola TaxID=2692330 RepID=A0A8J8SKQ5_9RHOB|nr:LacI family DNA-binding transcriptional regulator [Falsirhodobacter algicola]QUS35711.1 substrate-binding domain-containing protein [Falsirhodobacter algicola]
MRATVKDVARLAGVSPGTVSNTLSGARNVDAETRRRVEAAVAQLGYVPNLAARRFRTGVSNTIAVMTSMSPAVSAGSSRLGFLMEVAASAAVSALEHNATLVLVPPVADPAAALRNVAMDGAILIEPSEDDPFLELLLRRGVPVVIIGDPPRDGLAWIDMHYRATANMLVGHLLEQGARCVPLMIGASARRSYAEAEAAYRGLLQAEGLEAHVIRIPEALGEDAAHQAMLGLLKDLPALDGVFVPVDAFATGVMRALRDAGRAVPDDVKVATRYDGLRAREERPAITASNLHLDRIAALAVDRLVQLVAGTAAPLRIDGPLPTLVPRGSTLSSTLRS